MASGAEVIRKIKEQIEEVDPKEVHGLSQNGNGAVIVDVREEHEFEQAHLPGAVHVPRGHLESRIEGAVSDRSKRVILYCATGSRSALAAHTLQELLGYPAPAYFHHHLVEGPDGRKLSKSENDTGLQRLRSSGATPADVRRLVGLT